MVVKRNRPYWQPPLNNVYDYLLIRFFVSLAITSSSFVGITYTFIFESGVDISISSPPYGDNATREPYGQFSMLDLYIIDKRDLELEGWELDNYSIIDRMSLGGNKKETKLGEFEKGLIKPYLDKISIEKQEKVIRFFNDYFVWLEGLCKVTDKFIVLTLGNRTVDRIKINLTEITQKYLESREFKNIEFAEREIPNKRTPKVTSMVDLKPVDSMTKEYIIVHERRK